MTVLDRAVKMLLPREEGFFDLLERGAVCARDSGELLRDLCRAPTLEARQQKVALLRKVEHAADTVIHETYDALNKTFVTPIDRGDIYLLGNHLEEIVDRNHATAIQLIVHAMDDVPDGSVDLADLVFLATEEVAHGVRLLRNLKHLDRIPEHTKKLSELEHQGDAIFIERLASLFKTEKNAIRLIQHKEFLEGLERSLDACDHVGTVLKSIVIKNA